MNQGKNLALVESETRNRNQGVFNSWSVFGRYAHLCLYQQRRGFRRRGRTAASWMFFLLKTTILDPIWFSLPPKFNNKTTFLRQLFLGKEYIIFVFCYTYLDFSQGKKNVGTKAGQQTAQSVDVFILTSSAGCTLTYSPGE